jgi:hypothetical protein
MQLPIEIFTAPVDENFLCIICHGVFDDPTSLKCGHTFCLACLNLSLVTAGRCPTCRLAIPQNDEQIPNRVLKGLIENMTVRCKNSVCRDADDEPDRQRRRLNNCEASVTDDGCKWIGKLVDWPTHSKSECAMETVSCTVAGCDFRCARKGMDQHTINSITVHLDLLVTTKTETLRKKCDSKLEMQSKENARQLRTQKKELESKHETKLRAQHIELEIKYETKFRQKKKQHESNVFVFVGICITLAFLILRTLVD